MTTYIYGASDDLVEFEGDINDEFYTDSEDKAYFQLSDSEGRGHRVTVHYQDTGFWGVTLDELIEDNPCGWGNRLGKPEEVKYPNDYSAIMAIDTPEGVTVTQVDKNGNPLE